MNKLIYSLPFFTILCFISCDSNIPPKDKNLQYYIHVAHTRQADTIIQKVDPRIEQINYDVYDMTLLGGDICEETSKSYETLEYLEGLFDLDSPNTLWALGNHDNANLEYVTKATKRPITYTHHKNGITYVVLYTQEEADWKCHITGDQLDMLQNVMDTISNSSHLVIMTHKLVWIMDNPEFAEYQGISYYDWVSNYRIHKTNWNEDILPRMQAVQKRGIQVLCLAGDIGNNAHEFHEKTADNIHYLASGICLVERKTHDSKILLFKHDLIKKELFWRYAHLNSFLKNGQSMDAAPWHPLN